ncbi:hypothetical protein PH586_13410 [Pseudomonas sp. SA3-5]|uniref:Uncharacterized protein n=1 Tax=Pseudomonas aestuarii TaxID=3018340 RepID=A0ABT4XGQ8_9PSED|nr:hypothetical protein [Pseudomonas aestuarii]MDA7087384.1 hypothetical protein [Pseudomonas aestuarii]
MEALLRVMDSDPQSKATGNRDNPADNKTLLPSRDNGGTIRCIPDMALGLETA